MKRITKIEPASALVVPDKLKVAAYCRVSTDSEEQLVSLEAQKAHYEETIKANPAWEFAGLYYDEGISGSKLEKRDGLMQMLADCEDGKIDRVITKSISRFSRDTTDCLMMVRRLQDKGISVFFEKENIDTGNMDGELLLSFMSSLAEDELTSLSSNVKWGVQKRFRNGTFIIGSPPYGYKNEDGQMVVVEEERKIVRQIFDRCLAGDGARTIAKALNEAGSTTRGGAAWSDTTVRGILGNEKYTGDVVFQKTYTDENFNRHTNRGEMAQYYMADHHEAIVSREEFETVQTLLQQRASEKGNGKNTSRYQNRYAMSGKIKCGECGSTFKRRKHYLPGGEYIAWTCCRHLEDKDACGMKYITDDALKDAFITMMRKLEFSRRKLLQPLIEKLNGSSEIGRLLRTRDLDAVLEKNMQQREVLTKLSVSGYLENAVFLQQMNSLQAEEKRIQEEKQSLVQDISGEVDHMEEAKKLLRYVTREEPMTQFSEEAFTEFVDHVVVLSRELVEFHLKCGLKLQERLVK